MVKSRKNKTAGLFSVTIIFRVLFALYFLLSPIIAEENTTETDLDEFMAEDSKWKSDSFIRQSFLLNKSQIPAPYKTRTDLLSSYTRLRLGVKYTGEKLEAEASGNVDFIFSNYTGTPEFQYLWMTENRNRMFFMEKIHDEKDYLVRADVHRLNATYNSSKVKLKFGRQSISWGQSRFIDPLNLVTPTGPFIIDMEDIQGADGLDANYYINQTDFVELVVTPYRKMNDPDLKKLYYMDTNALLRYKGTFGNSDVMLVTGHHYHSWVWGGDISVTKWDASFRAGYLGRGERKLDDYAYFETNGNLPPKIAHQGVIGTSYAFSGKYRVNFETLFNSAYSKNNPGLAEHAKQEGLTSAGFQQPIREDQSFFVSKGRIITKQPVLMELALGAEFTDTISANLITIYDPVGKSEVIIPNLSWNFHNEGVLVAGLFLYGNHGREGEFIGAKPSAYIFMRWHF